MSELAITLDKATYDRAVAVLDAGQLRRALFQAVKRPTNRGTVTVQRRAQKKVNIQSKYLKRAIRTKLDIRDPDPPVGSIIISQKRLPLIAYRPTVSKRMGVTARIRKDKPPLKFGHAFKATVNRQNANVPEDLHEGIFIRTRHLSSNPRAGKLTPKGFAGRLAIKQLFGPSIHSVIDIPEVTEGIEADIAAQMTTALNSQIDRFTR